MRLADRKHGNFERGALARALDNGELSLVYQPKLDLGSRCIVGAEALLRWSNPRLGNVSPATFIPIAEETGLIAEIGEWALRRACEDAASWQRAGRVGVAVNLSPLQFGRNDLAATVAVALRRSGLPARLLELEITEGTAMSSPELAVAVLEELRALGVELSVDDFGTGYSSFTYLQRFPLDRLKIDRSFVRDMCSRASSEAIIAAMITLAHGLGLGVVVEGVETERQHAQLARMGCDQGQGFLYSLPVAVEAFHALLASGAQASSPPPDKPAKTRNSPAKPAFIQPWSDPPRP